MMLPTDLSLTSFMLCTSPAGISVWYHCYVNVDKCYIKVYSINLMAAMLVP